MTKVTGAFCDHANAPQNHSFWWHKESSTSTIPLTHFIVAVADFMVVCVWNACLRLAPLM
jgi:hypothetical protein